MNHKAIKVAKKKKRENTISNRQYVFLWLTIYSIGALILFFIWYLYPIMEWKLNYLKWQDSNVSDYQLYFSEAGVIFPQNSWEHIEYPIYDFDGSFHHMQLASVTKSDYGDSVELIFEIAFSRLRDCRVRYDTQYGFPQSIGCGSLKQENGGWWYVMYFEPLPND